LIKIAVISEEEQDRCKIHTILAPHKDFQIAGIGKDGYDALKTVEYLRPDIVIIDHRINNMDGAELAPIIKRRSPSTAVIVLGHEDEILWINRALNAGISGYLLKQVDLDKLAASIRTVFNGGCYISAPILNRAFNTLSQLGKSPFLRYHFFPAVDNSSGPDCCLSAIERRILTFIALGYSDKETANCLKLKPGTVRNYLSLAMQKTGLKRRTHTVVYALKHGLIDINQ
jgi:two-component system NarL family response regulator